MRSTSPSLQQSSSSCNIRSLQDNLDDLISSLAKEYNNNNNNKDSKNNVGKGKAKNYYNRSNNNSDIDNNDIKDSDKSNKVRECIE